MASVAQFLHRHIVACKASVAQFLHRHIVACKASVAQFLHRHIVMTSITDVHKIDLVYYAILLNRFSFEIFQTKLYGCNHINSKAFNTIHTSKDSYKYSFISRNITYWNSLAGSFHMKSTKKRPKCS